MSQDRRSFLKLLGLGVGAAVAAPVMAKVQEAKALQVNWSGSQRASEDVVQAANCDLHLTDNTNPHHVTKGMVGLGRC